MDDLRTPAGAVLDEPRTLACSLLVVEASRLLGDALAEQLRSLPWVDGVRTASGAREGLDDFEDRPPDLTLLSMQVPEAAGFVWAVLETHPAAKVVAMSVTETEDDIIACAELGVSGLLPVSGGLADLEQILTHVVRGLTTCSPLVAAALLKRVSSLAEEKHADSGARYVEEHLTPRERQVLELIERGLTNKEIAHDLCIEVRTVKNHVHNLLEKLRVNRRGEAAARLRSARVPSLEVLRVAGAGTRPPAYGA